MNHCGELRKNWISEPEVSMTALSARIAIVSSETDRHWLTCLRQHLKPRERTGELEVWDLESMPLAAEIEAEWQGRLGHSDVVVLLLSSHFLADDRIANQLLPFLFGASSPRHTVILAIVLTHCDYESLGGEPRMQFLCGQPLSELSSADVESALQAVSQEIRRCCLHSAPKAAVVERWTQLRQAESDAALLLEDLNRLAAARIRPSTPYIHRQKEEAALERRIGEVDSWISIIGESGTGKSTLLETLHATVATDPQSGVVRLFVDGSWLVHHGTSLAHTPLGPLQTSLNREYPSAWDLLCAAGERLRPLGKRLLVLFDTLDPVLLTSMRDRALQWLTFEAPRSNLQVVTTCRPLEADQGRLCHREPLRLDDFTDEQAHDAIGAYVEYYYKEKQTAFKEQVKQTLLHAYLCQPRCTDLCRRPVTLRMIFEAYQNGAPPKRITRNSLFREFWRKKVLGLDGRHSVPPEARQGLTLRLALRMASDGRPEPFLPGAEMLRIRGAVPQGREAYQALLSDGVLAQSDDCDPPGYVRFFHQSFLEYAVARAINQLKEERRQKRIERLLTPLRNEGADVPWFALLEELVLLADTAALGKQVLGALFDSAVPGALSTAASLWCRIRAEARENASERAKALRKNRIARLHCLRHLQDARLQSLPGLLRDFAVPAWQGHNIRQRQEALKTWARTAPLVPKAVIKQLRELRVCETIRDVATDANPGGRHGIVADHIGLLGRVLAALFGADDDFASAELNELQAQLLKRKSAKLSATLVSAIGARCEVSSVAEQLLYRWLEAGEPRGSGRQRLAEYRAALGMALCRTRPDEARLAHEQALLRGPQNEPRKRVLWVWYGRLEAGTRSLGEVLQHISPFADWPPSQQWEMTNILLLPLARAGRAELFHWLIQAAQSLGPPAPGRISPTRRCLLHALTQFPLEAEQARQALRVVGLDCADPTRLEVEELALLLAVTRTAEGAAAGAGLSASWPTARLLRVLPLMGATAQAEQLAVELLTAGKRLSPKEAGQFSLWLKRLSWHAARRYTRLGVELVARALPWLLEEARSGGERSQRAALQALPVFLGCGARARIYPAATRIAETLPRCRSDKEVTAVLRCLEGILDHCVPSAAEVEPLWQAAVDFLLGFAPDRETARETAYRLLDAIGRLGLAPNENIRLTADRLLKAIESQAERRQTKELVGIVHLAYRLAGSAMSAAWELVDRAVRLAERDGLGRHGWDSLRDAARRSVRYGLRDPETRQRILERLPTLPDHMQRVTIECASRADDDAVFALLATLREKKSLGLFAEQTFDAWAQNRGRLH